MTLSDFHGVATKQTLADAADPYFDKSMSAEGVDPEDTPRERLFDVIMLRFEAMEPHRDGLKRLMAWRERSPVQLAKLAGARKRSADWALISAGLDGRSALPASFRAIGVAWAMARAEHAWREETEPGFARTMARLDKELRRLEERFDTFARFTGQSRRRRADDAAPEPEVQTDPGPEPTS